MATLQELEQALIKADASGNVEDAKVLADEIKRIRASQQQTPPQEESFLDRRIDDFTSGLKATGSGVAKGVAGIASLPGLVERGMTYIPGMDRGILKDVIGTDWGEQSLGRSQSGKYVFPSYQDIRRNLDAVGAGPVLDYEPESMLGQFQQTGAEWATGGLLSKPALMPRMAGISTGGGMIAEGTEQLTGSEVGGAAAGIGSMIPIQMISGMNRSNASRMLQDALSGLDDASRKKVLSDAVELEKFARQVGIPLTGAESIGTQSMLDLLDLTRQNRYGAPIMDDFLRGRPDQTMDAIMGSLDSLAKKPTSSKEWAEKVQEVAEQYIKRAQQTRTAKSQAAGYTVADTEVVSPTLVNNIIRNIDEAMKASKPGEPVYRKLDEVRKRLISQPAKKGKVVDASGQATTTPPVPEIRMVILDGIRKDLDEVIQLSGNPNAKEAVKKIVSSSIRPIVNDIDEVLLTNPNFQAGRKMFENESKMVVNILEKYMGAFNKANIKPTAITKLVFDPKNVNAADVRKISKVLNDADPNIFPEIARKYLDDVFETAASPTQGGIINVGPKFAQKVFSGSNTEQRAVFMAMLDGVADAKNLSFSQTKDFKVGFERLMRVLQTTGKMPGGNSATYIRQQGSEIAKESTGGAIMDVFSTQPLQSTRNFLNKIAEKRTIEDLARIMTSPNSVEEIIKLSKVEPSRLSTLMDNAVVYGSAGAREMQQGMGN
jgi:hypothetical protein